MSEKLLFFSLVKALFVVFLLQSCSTEVDDVFTDPVDIDHDFFH